MRITNQLCITLKKLIGFQWKYFIVRDFVCLVDYSKSLLQVAAGTLQTFNKHSLNECMNQ